MGSRARDVAERLVIWFVAIGMGLIWWVGVCTLFVMVLGCSPKVVYVPVNTCPPPEIGTNPPLPVGSLQKDADIGTVVQTYAASLELCKGRVDELTRKLEGYLIP